MSDSDVLGRVYTKVRFNHGPVPWVLAPEMNGIRYVDSGDVGGHHAESESGEKRFDAGEGRVWQSIELTDWDLEAVDWDGLMPHTLRSQLNFYSSNSGLDGPWEPLDLPGPMFITYVGDGSPENSMGGSLLYKSRSFAELHSPDGFDPVVKLPAPVRYLRIHFWVGGPPRKPGWDIFLQADAPTSDSRTVLPSGSVALAMIHDSMWAQDLDRLTFTDSGGLEGDYANEEARECVFDAGEGRTWARMELVDWSFDHDNTAEYWQQMRDHLRLFVSQDGQSWGAFQGAPPVWVNGSWNHGAENYSIMSTIINDTTPGNVLYRSRQLAENEGGTDFVLTPAHSYRFLKFMFWSAGSSWGNGPIPQVGWNIDLQTDRYVSTVTESGWSSHQELDAAVAATGAAPNTLTKASYDGWKSSLYPDYDLNEGGEAVVGYHVHMTQADVTGGHHTLFDASSGSRYLFTDSGGTNNYHGQNQHYYFTLDAGVGCHWSFRVKYVTLVQNNGILNVWMQDSPQPTEPVSAQNLIFGYDGDVDANGNANILGDWDDTKDHNMVQPGGTSFLYNANYTTGDFAKTFVAPKQYLVFKFMSFSSSVGDGWDIRLKRVDPSASPYSGWVAQSAADTTFDATDDQATRSAQLLASTQVLDAAISGAADKVEKVQHLVRKTKLVKAAFDASRTAFTTSLSASGLTPAGAAQALLGVLQLDRDLQGVKTTVDSEAGDLTDEQKAGVQTDVTEAGTRATGSGADVTATYNDYLSSFSDLAGFLALKKAIKEDASAPPDAKKVNKRGVVRAFRQVALGAVGSYYTKTKFTIGAGDTSLRTALGETLVAGTVPPNTPIIFSDPAQSTADGETLHHIVDVDDVVDAAVGTVIPVVHTEFSAGDTVYYRYKNRIILGPISVTDDPNTTGALLLNGRTAGAGSSLVSVVSEETERAVDLKFVYSGSGGTSGQVAASAGSGSGDPYLRPYLLGGLMTKLPNKEQCYRLLDVGKLQVNARVGKLGSSEQKEITKRSGRLAETGGYFFREFVVRAEGGGLVRVGGDLRVLSSFSSTGELQVEEIQHRTAKSHFCPAQGELEYTRTVRIGLPGTAGVELRKYTNPQVRNGIFVWYCCNPTEAEGVLIDGNDRRARISTGRKGVLDFRALPVGKQKVTHAPRQVPKEIWGYVHG